MTARILGVGLENSLRSAAGNAVQAANILSASLAQGRLYAYENGSAVGDSAATIQADAQGNIIVSEYDITLTGAMTRANGEVRVLSGSSGFAQAVDGLSLVMPGDLLTGEHLVGPALVFGVRWMTDAVLNLSLDANPV